MSPIRNLLSGLRGIGVATAALLLVMAQPSVCHATPLLWAAVAQAPYNWAGGCPLCHTDSGSKGTANRPFAQTIKSHGISATSSTQDLTKVLGALSDEDSDSDGDPDLEELLNGTDPNTASKGKVRSVEYRYGCLPAAIPQEGSTSQLSWLWLVAAALVARRRWLTSLLAFLICLSLPTPAHAYCRTRTCKDDLEHGIVCRRNSIGCIAQGIPLSFDSPCLSFAVGAGRASELGISDQEFLEIVQRAFERWATVDCGQGEAPGLFVQSAGLVKASDINYCEEPALNANVWVLSDTWTLSADAIGNTVAQFDGDTGDVLDVDVQLNLKKILESVASESVHDVLLSIATHEAGHFLGLAHSDHKAAIMYAHYNEDHLVGRELTPDDIDGICDLLPPENAPTECSKAGVADGALDAKACKKAMAKEAAAADAAAPPPGGCAFGAPAQRQNAWWLGAAALAVLVGRRQGGVGRRRGRR